MGLNYSIAVPPEEPDHTDIWRLGLRFAFIAGEFEYRADKIRHVWLLGTWLYAFYRWMMHAFGYASTHCINFDKFIRRAVYWLEQLLNGSVFEDILESLSNHFEDIIDNATKWVRSTFADFNDETNLFVYNPKMWFWDKLTDLSEDLTAFFKNPLNGVLRFLNSKWWWFSGFFNWPENYIYYWVLNALPFLYDLMLDKTGWIIHWWTQYVWWLPDFLDGPSAWIETWAKLIPTDVGWFFTDPIEYIEYRISLYTGIPIYGEVGFLESLILNAAHFGAYYINKALPFFTDSFCRILILFM